jgi:hypothetical protein
MVDDNDHLGTLDAVGAPSIPSASGGLLAFSATPESAVFS